SRGLSASSMHLRISDFHRKSGRNSPQTRNAMSDLSWFAVVAEKALFQGDILRGCPVAAIFAPWFFLVQGKERSYEVAAINAIIMTQSCDLENNKTDLVLLAQVLDWQSTVNIEYRAGNTAIKSRDFRKKLIEGNIAALSLL